MSISSQTDPPQYVVAAPSIPIHGSQWGNPPAYKKPYVFLSPIEKVLKPNHLDHSQPQKALSMPREHNQEGIYVHHQYLHPRPKAKRPNPPHPWNLSPSEMFPPFQIANRKKEDSQALPPPQRLETPPPRLFNLIHA